MISPRFAMIACGVAVLVAAGLSVGAPSSARAQGEAAEANGDEGRTDGADTAEGEDEEVEVKRSREIRLDTYEARLERPAGWVRATPGAGAALTLRSAGNENAQIEVRVSSPIPADRKQSFFSAFTSSLEEAGFTQVALQKETRFAGHSGQWSEYTGSSDRGTFRLVVWQLYREETAWMFVGFFPELRADHYTDDFESFLESLRF